MKLLYLWVNCSQNGFIKKKGFNIAGEYFWEYDEENRTLFSKKKDGYIKGFWNEKDSCIEDLSIIVGTNGSGKSTLLAEIMNFNRILKCHVNEGDINHQIEQDKKLIVYENNGYVYFDHNFEYEVKSVPFIIRRSINSLDDCTNIFVSNSMENVVNEVAHTREGVYRFALTDFTINGQAKELVSVNKIPDYMYPSEEDDLSRYYDDPETHREENRGIDKIRKLNDLIHINSNAYEEINALIKLFFLTYSDSDQFMGKRYKNVNLHIRAEGEVFGNDTVMDESCRRKFKKIIEKTDGSLFSKLAAFYLFEFEYYYGEFITEDIQEISLEEIKEIKEYLKDIALRKGMDNLQENMTIDEYFLNAADDLILFHKLVHENEIISNQMGIANIRAYEFLRIDLNRNREFLERIFLFFRKKLPSFLLRYVIFQFEKESSGEEALLKLYSRIFWIYNALGCRRNNIILIDEIDLYMHPKWQRNLVNCLVEDIGKLVGSKNKAQIIITTHSPIFLSDIPKSNVVFLKNEEGVCMVDSNMNHKNTFGNNVHTLFLDSFFLNEEGTIGAFAEKRINHILHLLRHEERINDNEEKILKTINCIGDDLIRNKLLELYENNKGLPYQLKGEHASEKNTAIDNTVEILRKQVRELLRTIEQLEQMKND